jgi:hypothetical protein
MTFLEFIEEVEAYIRMPNNSTVRPQLKIIINEAILEFCKLRDWEKLKTTFDFTTGKSFAITAVDHAVDNTVSISGDNAFKFKIGDTVTISGSTNNDGDYTVAGVSPGSTTTLTLTEALTDSTVDGTLSSEHEDYGVPDGFVNEIELYNSDGNRIEKVSYERYQTETVSVWSLLRDRIQITGEDAEVKLFYISRDDELVDNDDESNVIDHYKSIIKLWAVYKFYLWYGADESAARTEVLLKNDINILRANESRAVKNGRNVIFSTYNR